MTTLVSVIVPVYREPMSELASLVLWMKGTDDCRVEWIVVKTTDDGGNLKELGVWLDEGQGNGTLTVAGRLQIKVVEAKTGRSAQMNEGARHASGKVLLFLHADTRLETGWIDEIERTAEGQRGCWGSFTPKIEAGGLFYRIAELWGLWRSRLLGLPYGDQALFVDRRLFFDAGSLDENVQFMEELDLGSRLLKRGIRPHLLPVQARTSCRKWAKYGFLYSFKNLIAFLLYLAGVSRNRIGRWYKGGAC